MSDKIVFLRGLWSHPNAVLWIKDNIEKSTDLSVDLFDYHDELIQDVGNDVYLKRVVQKYGDLYGSNAHQVILMGHSHGGALAAVLNSEQLAKRVILVNPAIRPWGVFRRVPNTFRQVLSNMGLGSGYEPHFVVKYDNELEERKQYFAENFKLSRDLSRIIWTGDVALDSLRSIRNDLLLIQSMKDEFISVSTNLRCFEEVPLSEYKGESGTPSKEIMKVSDGEHAVLEESGEYPKVYKKIADFIQR